MDQQQRPEWHSHALCRSQPAELWFPERGNSAKTVRRAKKICRVCPVRAACLRYALTKKEEFGVWGGMTTSERRALARANTTGGRRAAG